MTRFPLAVSAHEPSLTASLVPFGCCFLGSAQPLVSLRASGVGGRGIGLWLRARILGQVACS